MRAGWSAQGVSWSATYLHPNIKPLRLVPIILDKRQRFNDVLPRCLSRVSLGHRDSAPSRNAAAKSSRNDAREAIVKVSRFSMIQLTAHIFSNNDKLTYYISRKNVMCAVFFSHSIPSSCKSKKSSRYMLIEYYSRYKLRDNCVSEVSSVSRELNRNN